MRQTDSYADVPKARPYISRQAIEYKLIDQRSPGGAVVVGNPGRSAQRSEARNPGSGISFLTERRRCDIVAHSLLKTKSIEANQLSATTISPLQGSICLFYPFPPGSALRAAPGAFYVSMQIFWD